MIYLYAAALTSTHYIVDYIQIITHYKVSSEWFQTNAFISMDLRVFFQAFLQVKPNK